MADFGSVKASSGKSPCPKASKGASSIPFKDGWTSEKVLAIPKGQRPDPSVYLEKSYIDSHLGKFEGGASVIKTKATLDRYGDTIGPDGLFMMPKAEMDALLKRANGDKRVIEKELGFQPGQLEGEALVRIDIPDPKANGLKMPSGNEPGANELWLPGGKTSGGRSEAVSNKIPKENYTKTPIL